MESAKVPLDSPVHTLGGGIFYIVRGLTLGSLFSEIFNWG